MLEVVHDDIPVLLENGHRDEDMIVGAHVIGPEALPEPEHVEPLKLALVPDEEHAEEEEKVGTLGLLEMKVELRVEQLHQLIQRQQLLPHATLVAEKVALHPRHEADKCPKGQGVVL